MASTIALEAVTKFYGETYAVGPVDLEIREGEFFSLLGPSGCGKTTTLRLIGGFEEASAGTIRIGDSVVNRIPVEKRGVGMVFQSYALFPHLSVFENVAFGLRLRRVAKPEIERRVGDALKLVDLGGLAARMPRQLSGGQQQRAALARALVVEPSVLLLDEPLSNLDLKLREQMREEIRRLQRRLGITAVYVTHDQGEAMAVSDRTAVMNAGRIEQVGTPREIYEHPRTMFVASFIGQCNFLAGSVVGQAGEHLDFVSERGTRLEIARREVGEAAATVVIRPEAVALSFHGGAGDAARGSAPNRLTARVEELVYLGDKIGVTLSLDTDGDGPGERLLASEQISRGQTLPAVGDRLSVEIPAEECILIDSGRPHGSA